MLTSSNGNQYLRPEYLTPLPTTLDAKKSPLALLAQTCSQIGADPPVLPSSNKSSLLNGTSSSNNNNHESHSSLSTGKSKGSGPCAGNGSQSKALHQDSHHPTHRRLRSTSSSPHTEKSLKKTHQPTHSPSSDLTPLSFSPRSTTPINTSTPSTLTPLDTDKPQHYRSKTPSNSKASTPNPHNPSPSSSSSSSSSTNPTNKSPPSFSTPAALGAADAIPSSAKAFQNVTDGFTTATSSILSSPPSSTLQLPISSTNKLNPSPSPSALTFNAPSSLDLTLKHGLPFPALFSSPSTGTVIPPYLHSYARLKAAAAANVNSEASQLSPTCRDPFCTGCHLGAHALNFGLKTCPAGCLQCDHQKNPLSNCFNFPFLSGLPLPPSLANLYASSLQHQSQQPYVCNWFVGESYCGKRFTSSDELLQHLRSHTTLGNSGPNGVSQEAVQNLAAAALAAGYPTPPGFFPLSSSHHPLLGASHALLNRTYPTPPLSPLSSGRFHPYAKGGGGGLSGSPLSSISSPNLTSTFLPPGFHMGHPAFSPYYPYSLYGQRLGTSGSLHP